MKVLLVHPGPLVCSKIYLRLEPLGMERVAQALRSAGHELRLVDLQIFRHVEYFRELADFEPQAVGFSLNYLANVPEVIDLAVATKRRVPGTFVFVGGHIASFIPEELLEHGCGAIDCVIRGEGELTVSRLLEEMADGDMESIPGVVTTRGSGPPPSLLDDLDAHPPARDLTRRRNRYFLGILDPCASIEFTRGCPWNCSFCSAWTFYGRTYRKASPEAIAEDMARIEEPNVFVVDDVAFVHPEHGYAIGREIERRGIRKRYYVETRSDVLIRNREVFEYWKKLGLKYMFLGIEAIDQDGLSQLRKRVSLGENFRALEVARSLGIIVAINIIVDPGWDEERFRVVREWAEEVPEIVYLTIMTPYPGTENWYTEPRKLTNLDYRLFDVHHAVLPTRLPLKQFYEEFFKTQAILGRKHLKRASFRTAARETFKRLRRGQMNFVKMIWKYNSVYDPKRQYSDHFREVKYSMSPPPNAQKPALESIYIHRSCPSSEIGLE